MSVTMPPDPPPPTGEADYGGSGARRQPTLPSAIAEDLSDQDDHGELCSPQITKLLTALTKASKTFDPVVKDSYNSHFKTKYPSLNAYQTATRTHLADNGLVVVQLIRQDILYTRLYHESGEWLQSRLKLYMAGKGAQALGGELTFLKRYCYSAILNMSAVEDDDDGEAAQEAAGSRQASPDRRPPPPPQRTNTRSDGGAGQAFGSAGLPPKVRPAPPANGHQETPHNPETGEVMDDWLYSTLDRLNTELSLKAWEDAIKRAYNEAPSIDAIKAIDAAPTVVRAMQKAPANTKSHIQTCRRSAHERLAHEAFPGDTPNERAGADG